MTRLIATIAALAMLIAGAKAETTNPAVTGSWTNIGTGPLTIQQTTNRGVEVYSSATTPDPAVKGHRLTLGAAFTFGDSVVWARTVDGSTATLVVTPSPAGSGGGGSVTITGPLPAFAAAPAFNLSQIGGAALALGQATMAGSIPVVLPSNQSAIPVTGTFWQATQPVSWSGMTVAATIADGSDASQGAKSDAAWSGTGDASMIGLLKAIYAGVYAPTPAGTNNIGKTVRVDGSGNTAPAGDVNFRHLWFRPTDGTNNGVFKAASTPPTASDTPLVVAISPNRAGIAPAGSTALENGRVLKASAGYLSSIYAYTQSTSDRWVLIFDSASVPADGAVTPKYYWKAKTDGSSGWLWWEWNMPAQMASGVSVSCSSTGPFTKTAVADCAFSAQVQ